MEIARDFYLNKLISKIGNRLVKIITGMRRCGKSYLLNTIFYRHLIASGVREDHIIRFAFDDADDLELIGERKTDLERERRKVDPDRFTAFIRSRVTDADTYYLLLDEVQEMECFESVLNGYLRRDNVDVYVTGSNARFLSSDIITEFAGRGDEVRMHPLSFSEFMSVCDADRYEGLTRYMIYGGIPQVVLEDDESEKERMLESLTRETYLSDIVRRNRIRTDSRGDLEDLLSILSSSVGSLTNPERLMNTFRSVKRESRITAMTIRKYIDCFEDAFLMEGARRYDVKGRKYMESPKKYYFEDLGIRNAIVGFRQFERTHAMENVVYNELRTRGYRVDVGVVPVVERGEDGRTEKKQLEIDFVCNAGSSRYYVQSAYSLSGEDTRKREYRALLNTSDQFKKIIVTGDVAPAMYDERGIQTVGIYDFLLDPDSLKRDRF